MNPPFTNLQSLFANLTDPANDTRRVIGALINETLAHAGETWVFLDDLHLIAEPAIFSALDYWLERMPPHMHLVVATRYDPPLVLARLRARGQLAEVRVPNLRFTTDEARAAFKDGGDLKALVLRRKGERVWAEQNRGPATYGKPPAQPSLDILPSEPRFLMTVVPWYMERALSTGRGRVQQAGANLTGIAASQENTLARCA